MSGDPTVYEGPLYVCPECVQGKHWNCDGTAWDLENDMPGPCGCTDWSHRDSDLEDAGVSHSAPRVSADVASASTAPGSEIARVDYVVGFAFDQDGRSALIEKNRPQWQAGRLNGIGGHIEPGEHPAVAMRREFLEETGADLTGWDLFVVMDFPGARIYFYRLLVDQQVLNGLRTTTDEPVVIIRSISSFDADRIIPNLSWLLPLAMYSADRYEPIHVAAAVTEAVLPPSDPERQKWCAS
jgi:8-oxo-dGTP diphosphatase